MDLMQIAVAIIGPAIAAMFGWMSKISKSVQDLRITVAENYITRQVMRETLEPLRDDMEHLKTLITRIATRLNVETRD